MAEYISRESVLDKLAIIYDLARTDQKAPISCAISDIKSIKAADVQPLSVVTEHIKQRLYETAFNTTEEKARNAIADMAGRIDFWIDELKGGETNA